MDRLATVFKNSFTTKNLFSIFKNRKQNVFKHFLVVLTCFFRVALKIIIHANM